MELDPLNDRILRKGYFYRIRVPREPKRELAPEVLETVRRGREKVTREYLEKKKRMS